MKAQSYTLRFGTPDEIRELALSIASQGVLLANEEIESFLIRAQFAQQMMLERSEVTAELKIIAGRLYISGSADGLMFTI